MINLDQEDLINGPCCCCGKMAQDMRTILILDRRAPPEARGKGWGCFVCSLPMDGAVAVACDACTGTQKPATSCCAGAVRDPQRAPIAGLEPFEHDALKHEADDDRQRELQIRAVLEGILTEVWDELAPLLPRKAQAGMVPVLHCGWVTPAGRPGFRLELLPRDSVPENNNPAGRRARILQDLDQLTTGGALGAVAVLLTRDVRCVAAVGLPWPQEAGAGRG